MADVFIYDALRTPRGRGKAGKGGLSNIHPAAIVKTLNKPKTHVSVPPPLRFTAQAAQLLPPKGRRWMNRKLGLDGVFLQFDAAKRKSYEDRARAAQGVIESGGAANPS